MEKEKVEQGETNPWCRLPPTKQAEDKEQLDATPSWTGSWR